MKRNLSMNSLISNDTDTSSSVIVEDAKKKRKKSCEIKTNGRKARATTNLPSSSSSSQVAPMDNNSNFSPQSSVYVDDSDATNQSEDVALNMQNGHSHDKLNIKKQKYKYTMEDHRCNIYGLKIYKPHLMNNDSIIFATVGGNRCSIYEYKSSKRTAELLDVFVDADDDEVFYTLDWSTDSKNNAVLSIGGAKGIIRTILPFKGFLKNALIGHGSAINDLIFHPFKSNILLSSSKDNTNRLWNINTNVCIAIFGGAEGHRDEVLSADFNKLGTLMISCGMDHFFKIWNMQTAKLSKAIDDSETFSCKLKFEIKECDVWFIRFCLDSRQHLMSLGTTTGKIYVWNLNLHESNNERKRIVLTHTKSKRAIRATGITFNGADIIAANDEGSIFIWQREHE